MADPESSLPEDILVSAAFALVMVISTLIAIIVTIQIWRAIL